MRRKLVVLAQLILAAIVLAFAALAIARQWDDVRGAALEATPRWGIIVVSVLPVLAAYGLLVQTWRLLLGGWNARVSFATAARIWFISNLGRYVPGRFWQVGAMGVLAQRAGVAPAAAIGSALVATIITTLVGFAIVFASGLRVLEAMAIDPTAMRLGVLLFIALGVALLAAPLYLPRLASAIRLLTGRDIDLPAPSQRSVWFAAAAAALSWILYGIAFRIFAAGTIGALPGTIAAYVAVFVASYLVGYLVLFAPGGIIFREAAMIAGLTTLGLTTVPQATLLALASRLWLTLIEVTPGVILLATGGVPQTRSPSSNANV